MSRFPSLTPPQAISLVRAARSYQLALWMADSEPNLSWLLLVSAVETAAACWSVSSDDPVAVLKKHKPAFTERLAKEAGEEAVKIVADEFAETMRATAKFVNFLESFLPPPPDKRPPESSQHDWSPAALKKSIQRIYRYRSKALHEGLPFPVPMCERPFKQNDWEAHTETPVALATSALGGVWTREDTPMHLHVFEHIVRRSLLSWLNSIDDTAQS